MIFFKKSFLLLGLISMTMATAETAENENIKNLNPSVLTEITPESKEHELNKAARIFVTKASEHLTKEDEFTRKYLAKTDLEIIKRACELAELQAKTSAEKKNWSIENPAQTHALLARLYAAKKASPIIIEELEKKYEKEFTELKKNIPHSQFWSNAGASFIGTIPGCIGIIAYLTYLNNKK